MRIVEKYDEIDAYRMLKEKGLKGMHWYLKIFFLIYTTNINRINRMFLNRQYCKELISE